jgi:hypothetical protein
MSSDEFIKYMKTKENENVEWSHFYNQIETIVKQTVGSIADSAE